MPAISRIGTSSIQSAPVRAQSEPVDEPVLDPPAQPDVPGGNAIGRVDVDPARKLVALTFDDGVGAATGPILDVLAAQGVPATFFVLGENIAGNGDTLRRMAREGHAIGNHSWSHPELTSLSDEGVLGELGATQQAIIDETGVAPQVFRPPYGARDSNVDALAGQLGLRDIIWDVDTEDWKQPGAGGIRSTAVANAQAGSIILMHDGGGDRDQTLEALPGIISDLRAQGYEFTTVPELVKAGS